MTRRRQGVIEEGPALSSEDLALAGMSTAEICRRMKQHVHTHGIGSNLVQFLDNAETLARQINRRADSLAAKTAGRLIYDVDDLRVAVRNGVDPGLLFTAVCAGLAYANLVIDARHGKRVDVRIASEDGFAKGRHVKARKLTDAQIVAILKNGRTRKEQAKKAKVSVSTIRDWRKEFRAALI